MSATPPLAGSAPQSLVLDVKQTAEVLKVSVPTVRRFIKRQELRAIHLGTRVVVMTEDIVAFLKKKREEQTPDPLNQHDSNKLSEEEGDAVKKNSDGLE